MPCPCRRTAAVLALIVAAAACPAAQKIPDDVKPELPKIAGRFASDACTAQPSADGLPSWIKTSVELGVGSFTMDIAVFGDEACATKNATVHVEGALTLGAPVAGPTGTLAIERAPSKRTVTPHVDGFVAVLQSYSCGAPPYAVNEPQDILEAGCKDLGYLPRAACATEHDIALLEGDALRFGERAGCTPGERPTALSAISLKRVP